MLVWPVLLETNAPSQSYNSAVIFFLGNTAHIWAYCKLLTFHVAKIPIDCVIDDDTLKVEPICATDHNETLYEKNELLVVLLEVASEREIVPPCGK